MFKHYVMHVAGGGGGVSHFLEKRVTKVLGTHFN